METTFEVPLLYRVLTRIRPAFVADQIKWMLGVSRQEIRTTSGLTFWADPASDFGHALWQHGVYEGELTRTMEKVLRPGDTFLDIGANEGYFSVLAGKLVGEGRVEAFEPQTRLLDVFERNLELNGVPNVTLHHVALSDHNGEGELYLSSGMNTGGSGIMVRGRMQASQPVRLVKLDTLLQERDITHARLAKIDVEGAETFVLPGMLQTLQGQRIDILILEFHGTVIGDQRCRELGVLLRECGYVLSQAVSDGQWFFHTEAATSSLAPLGELRRLTWPD